MDLIAITQSVMWEGREGREGGKGSAYKFSPYSLQLSFVVVQSLSQLRPD